MYTLTSFHQQGIAKLTFQLNGRRIGYLAQVQGTYGIQNINNCKEIAPCKQKGIIFVEYYNAKGNKCIPNIGKSPSDRHSNRHYHNKAFTILGLTGFDSRQKWYVSMQCVGDWHYNLSYQNIIWQRKLRSRCLIEVQQIKLYFCHSGRNETSLKSSCSEAFGLVAQ